MENKGITLIALVVTIIVLLILAGVTISLVIGQNGIITRAKEASVRQDNATVLEVMRLKVADIGIDILGNGVMTEEETELRNQGYMNSSNIVNVEKAVGKKLETGNGTDNDIYKVENGILNYYDKQGNKTELGEIYVPITYPETDPSLFEFEPETGTIWLKDAFDYYEGYKDFPDEVMVIPSQIDGVPVKVIGKDWRSQGGYFDGVGAKNIKKIIIPNTVTEIGGGAFAGCEVLEDIQIPENVTKIGHFAFHKCYMLKKIKLPNKVTSIGDYAFATAEGLTELILPDSLITIGEGAFYGCYSLNNMTIPKSVTSIGMDAFYHAYIETITIEAGSSLVIPEDRWGAPSSCTITKL